MIEKKNTKQNKQPKPPNKTTTKDLTANAPKIKVPHIVIIKK